MAKDNGNNAKKQIADLQRDIKELQEKNRELEETLDAIRSGEVDAIIVAKGDARQVYTLEGSDHPYRSLVENIREGALTLSRDGMILYTNSRFAEMVKVPAEKIAGTSILDYVCPENLADMTVALREILKKSCRTRLRIRQGEKGSLPVLISMNPLDHQDDTKISVVITDRRKDEDRIQLQARMLDSVGDAVIATDPDRKIIYWNEAATRTYGWNPEEIMGHDLGYVKTRNLPEKEDRKIAGRLAKGDTWTGEYVGHHRDGRMFPVHAHDAPVFDDSGKFIAVIGASHDITEEKQAKQELANRNEELNILNEELVSAQEKLRQTNDELTAACEEITAAEEELRQNVDELTAREHQLKETLAEKEILLSEIHHRVKNNLAAFISLLSLEGTYEETEAGLALKKDLQNRARTMALIHETLYRTRQFSDVDMDVYLSTLVEQVVGSYGKAPRLIRTMVNVKGVTLDLARATPIGLIVNELVTNSLKYAFPSGVRSCRPGSGEECTVRIVMRRTDGSYLLEVADNGIGLPPGFEIRTSRSLGLKLVYFLSLHQLQTQPEVSRDCGTRYTFRFNE